MAKQNIDTLKNWFKTGLEPIQKQFWDWMDSYFHKDDKIPMDSVEGLSTTINNLPSKQTVETQNKSIYGEPLVMNEPDGIVLPAGSLLEMIRVNSTVDFQLRIGSAPGLDDVLPDVPVQANNTAPIILWLPANANRTIYLSGFIEPITLTIYKR